MTAKFLSLLVCAACLLSGPTGPTIRSAGAADAPAGSQAIPSRLQAGAAQPSARLSSARLPVFFIPNGGQVDPQVAYYVQGRDKSLYFTSRGITFALTDPGRKRWVAQLDFISAQPDVRPQGEDKTGAVVSYFRGRPDEWQAGLPTFHKIVYPDLWPGIDLSLSGSFDRLKYEFVVRPGADPAAIRLAYRGIRSLRVDETGRLEVSTPAGGFSDDRPVAYQERGGKKLEIPVAYQLEDSAAGNAPSEAHAYGFRIGDYDRSRPLVLDPAVFIHAGYFGGSSWDMGNAIAIDAAGYIYLTGDTISSETISFPATVGPDLTHNGGEDAFVVKLKPGETGIVYCGYIGGGADDWGNGIAVDGAGNAYVTGETMSSETAGFPVTVGPDLTFGGGNKDAFIARVKADGTALDYCGYIGGTGDDFGLAIAADAGGNAYVTGNTYSNETTGFPFLVGPDLTGNGQGDAFVCKISPSGSFVYSGFIGGNADDYGRGMAVDPTGHAYITGRTSSMSGFPVKIGPGLIYRGNNDCFVAKVKADGTGLDYCGYIGGLAGDDGRAITIDAAGNAYVTGNTASTQAMSFPILVGPDLTHNGSGDAFVAKVKADGTGLDYCGYIGGSGGEEGDGIAVDTAGNAYVCGYTNSSQATFPVKAGPDLTYASGVYDGFVARVNASGSALDYCGYIGGTDTEIARGVVVDRSGNAWVTGWTMSSFLKGFPYTGFIIYDLQGPEDAFLVNIGFHDERVSSHAVGDFDGDGQDEAAIDFGSAGAWLYDGTAWSQLTTADPEGLTAADVDGDGAAEIIADLGGLGLWLWNAGTWNMLSGVNADGVSAGDVDGDGTAEVIGDFGSSGLWLLDGGAWTQLSGVNADYAAVGNLDGIGGAEVVGDFGGAGLWVWNAGGWTQLSGVNVDYFVFGNVDGTGGADIVCDFGTTGLWLYAGGGWSQLSGANADNMLAADLDGDGLDEIVVNFPGWGLWEADGATWTVLSNLAAVVMTAANVDGGAAYELAAGFGGIGLFLNNGGVWTALSSRAPEFLLAGDLDGDSTDEILADAGALGLWLWDSGSWSQISSLNPN